MSRTTGLTMWQAAYIGLGNIIGAGIFVLAGSIIAVSGAGALIAFFITAVLATTVALNSAELSSRIVSHGGLYSFVRVSMGDSLGFIVGWLRVLSYVIGAAAVALGFSAYILNFISPEISSEYTLPVAIALIIGVIAVNWSGITNVARIEHYLVFITVSGLILFVVLSLTEGIWRMDRFLPLVPAGPFSLIEAASLAFFAY
ncbi:MAG TPA: amino acid permease, partial [Methanomicrobiales archaeon]|nr:amino acid permease [Methanomicrobiales archaeon]